MRFKMKNVPSFLMKSIKKFLAKILSQKAYLRTLHRVFYILYDLVFLKNDPTFKYHYAVKKIIQKDFVVVDIGLMPPS